MWLTSVYICKTINKTESPSITKKFRSNEIPSGKGTWRPIESNPSYLGLARRYKYTSLLSLHTLPWKFQLVLVP